MFSRFTRLSLPRGFHTVSGNSYSSRVKILFAASGTAYIGYQITTQNPLHLDSTQFPSSAAPSKQQPKILKISTTTPLPPTTDANTPEFIPDGASEPDNTLSSDRESTPQEESSSKEPEGEAGSAPAASQGAYDPVTGEINWDCPCLGGMAHGPCGEEFKEAFSCFIYSEAEPKGINCVEKFQAMQTCFRAHPDVYADEIMNDDENDDVPISADDAQTPPQPTNDTLDSSDTEAQVVASTDSSTSSS